MVSPRQLVGRVAGRVRDDLRADPYLPYILLGALLLAGFWFWHRIPNFATRDEKERLLDPLVAYGRVLADPGFESLREGVAWGRVPFGATFYLFGLCLLPVVIAAAVLGDLGAITGLGFPADVFGYYPAWQAVPEWIWVSSLTVVRLANVAFAVGSVYLTYRFGTAMRDRWTGRLSAVLLTLTFGFLTIAHEGGEDMPALFFVLLTLYLALRYVQTGDGGRFYGASVAGGVAIAFKLTAAPVVLLVGLAHLLRSRRAGDHREPAECASDEAASRAGTDWRDALLRPRLVATGALLGLVTVVLGFPTFLVAGPEPFVERVFGDSIGRASSATGPPAPIWWWFLRGYFSALSLPLFVAAVGGVLAGVAALRSRTEAREREGLAFVLALLVTYLVVFSQWQDFRVHHLLPTFPLLALLVARGFASLRASRPRVATPLLAVLLVTTGTYAVAGDVGYAFMPRDQANDWIDTHVDDEETMEVYRGDLQDAVVPHEQRIRYEFAGGTEAEDCPRYIQLTYRDRLVFKTGEHYGTTDAQREYLRRVIEGEYGYVMVAAFGPQPGKYAPDRPTPGSLVEILPLGLRPQTDQYSDEQELATNQYTAIYERVGPCDPSRDPPF
ncbi:ArnT family glycosyltransferase [Halorientalis halophila]|uniref:ArnT family glycosyltransferase n=1 Tax=Halorientalis halophila TaxID=3108499 RepID=UPI003008B949